MDLAQFIRNPNTETPRLIEHTMFFASPNEAQTTAAGTAKNTVLSLELYAPDETYLQVLIVILQVSHELENGVRWPMVEAAIHIS